MSSVLNTSIHYRRLLSTLRMQEIFECGDIDLIAESLDASISVDWHHLGSSEKYPRTYRYLTNLCLPTEGLQALLRHSDNPSFLEQSITALCFFRVRYHA
jgi:hypothetical protein